VITDARVLADQIATHDTSNLVNQLPLWLQGIQAIAAVATTLGVLIALYVAVVREPKKAAEQRERRKAQIETLRRAASRRVAAQARKVVPSCVRAPMFGESWWIVRVDNASNAVVTILAVDVAAIDARGNEVPDGCKQANNTIPVDQAFDRSISAALSASSAGGFEPSSFGEMTFADTWQQRHTQLPPALKHALRDALVGHFAAGWQRILPPSQRTVMAYTTTKPEYTLRITLDYEDEAGFLWRRTDTSRPTRMDER
jgi:hypothetical protein